MKACLHIRLTGTLAHFAPEYSYEKCKITILKTHFDEEATINYTSKHN